METRSAEVDRYAVVGNPVSHSLSPRIHQAFARQSQQLIEYDAIELALGDFETQIRKLCNQGLKGANVTVPFKREAWEICDEKSQRAEDAGAVNTLAFKQDGMIAGDNTDGVGLTRDLIDNHHLRIKQSKILVLGAGGAVRGVLAPLLALKPDRITIANRTVEKAQKLAENMRSFGDIEACGFDRLGADKYDLIINATAAGLKGEVPPIPEAVLGFNSFCYDMMYSIDSPTAFVSWAREHSVSHVIDGLGMLVEQAAESFFIWRDVRVDTAKVIAELRT